jgi:hypothetical protein
MLWFLLPADVSFWRDHQSHVAVHAAELNAVLDFCVTKSAVACSLFAAAVTHHHLRS